MDKDFPSAALMGGGGRWCAPKPSGTTLCRHLGQDARKPAWPALPPVASLPATRPDPSGPSPGRAPAARFFTAEMPSLPRSRAGGGRRRGGVHRGPPPQSAAGMRGDTGAEREPPRRLEREPGKEVRGDRVAHTQRVGWEQSAQARHAEPRTPHVRPRAGSGLFPRHLSSLSGPPIQVHSSSTSSVPHPPQPLVWDEIKGPSPLIGTRRPRPRPFSTNHDPPTYFGETTSNPPPIPLPGDLTLGPSPLIGTRRSPPQHSSNFFGLAPFPYFGASRLGSLHFWERFSTWGQAMRTPSHTGLRRSSAALGQDPSPLPTGINDPLQTPAQARLTAPGPRCASGQSPGPERHV